MTTTVEPVTPSWDGTLFDGTFRMSALVNYTLVGMPDSATVNAVNPALTGLVSGFNAGFIGLLAHQRKASAAAKARNPPKQPHQHRHAEITHNHHPGPPTYVNVTVEAADQSDPRTIAKLKNHPEAGQTHWPHQE